MLNLINWLGHGSLCCPILKRFSEKIRNVENHRDALRTIVLGSSHAEKGFCARTSAFNLGCDFQDLYYSREIYRWCESFPNLENVIVFYSVFSRGYDLIMTNDAQNCVAFKVLCGINYRNQDRAQELGLFDLERTALRKVRLHLNKVAFDREDRGNERTYHTVYAGMNAANRALGHLKNNRRSNGMVHYLRQIIDDATAMGRRIVVVIPPATAGYRTALPDKGDLFADLSGVACDVVDMWDSSIFSDSDFIDPDHLSRVGAEKLTQQLLRTSVLHSSKPK